MSRPVNEGLEYYPQDVDFYDDPKVLLIEEQYGIKGVRVMHQLLCWIYRNGYYLKWDDDMALVFAKRVGNGLTYSFVSDVVNVLVLRRFFDKALFERHAILTSAGIQKRWKKIIEDSRRKARMNPEFEINVDSAQINSAETPPKRTLTIAERTESTQSKVKESKVNETETLTEDRLMSELKIEDCHLPRGEIGYRVIEFSITLFEILKELYPLNRDIEFYTVAEFVPSVRELLQKKKYKEDQVREVLRWAHGHKFWTSQIMHPKSIVTNFEKMKFQCFS